MNQSNKQITANDEKNNQDNSESAIITSENNNNPETTPDSNQSNSLPKSIPSDYPEFPEANQTFILQLVPIKQQESNQSEAQLFEAKLIDPLNNER